MQLPIRIEVYEKYPLMGEHGEDYYENLGMKPPPSEYGYRRTMPLLEMIERPVEIPGNKKECMLIFWSGETMTILNNYDEFCVMLNDLEMQQIIDDYDEEEEGNKQT